MIHAKKNYLIMVIRFGYIFSESYHIFDGSVADGSLNNIDSYFK